MVRSREGEQRARATLQRQAAREQAAWEKRMWHLGNRAFACEADAQAAFERELRQAPSWLRASARVVAVPKYRRVGCPRSPTAPPSQEWHVQVTLTRDPAALEREALRRAAFIVATNVLDEATLLDRELIATYKAQSAVERGFAFLKDPLFLASSVFVKKPHRIMALAFIMVLCLLVYRLAEVRVRERLAAMQETVPDQLRRPTTRPTMRWLFQCFPGHRSPPHDPPRGTVRYSGLASQRRPSPRLTPPRTGLRRSLFAHQRKCEMNAMGWQFAGFFAQADADVMSAALDRWP